MRYIYDHKKKEKLDITIEEEFTTDNFAKDKGYTVTSIKGKSVYKRANLDEEVKEGQRIAEREALNYIRNKYPRARMMTDDQIKRHYAKSYSQRRQTILRNYLKRTYGYDISTQIEEYPTYDVSDVELKRIIRPEETLNLPIGYEKTTVEVGIYETVEVPVYKEKVYFVKRTTRTGRTRIVRRKRKIQIGTRTEKVLRRKRVPGIRISFIKGAITPRIAQQWVVYETWKNTPNAPSQVTLKPIIRIQCYYGAEWTKRLVKDIREYFESSEGEEKVREQLSNYLEGSEVNFDLISVDKIRSEKE